MRLPSLSWELPRSACWGLNIPAFSNEKNRLALLSDELYLAMLEAGYATRRNKIPGLLAHTIIVVARKPLELWRRDRYAFLPQVWRLARSTSGRQMDSCLSPQISMEVYRKRLASIYYSPKATERGSQPSKTGGRRQCV